jgi:sec-independent protein translocase protein TatA
MNTMAFIPNLGAPELIILGVIMLLLFGRRLPEVGRSLGQGIVQFKKGLKDIETEVDQAASRPEPAKFEAARTPTDAQGQDVRVSQSAPVETPVSEGGTSGS